MIGFDIGIPPTTTGGWLYSTTALIQETDGQRFAVTKREMQQERER